MREVEAVPECIQAAGAVLWLRGSDGGLLIALVHRPRYDDWSLPKGKVEDGESYISCAYREVLEETGISAIFGPEVGETVYDVDGVTKKVRYWAARASEAPKGTPNPEEVDEVRWLRPVKARSLLTLDDDRSILDFFLEYGPDTTPLVLLRHARAIKRDEWNGDDDDRPLDRIGQRQAKRLLPDYFPYGIAEIYSSDAIRCLETIEPISRSLDLSTIISEDLGVYRHSTDKEAALDFAQVVMNRGKAALMCSHNPILPKLMKNLVGKKNFKKLERKLDPAQAWVLHHRGGEIVAIDWVDSPYV